MKIPSITILIDNNINPNVEGIKYLKNILRIGCSRNCVAVSVIFSPPFNKIHISMFNFSYQDKKEETAGGLAPLYIIYTSVISLLFKLGYIRWLINFFRHVVFFDTHLVTFSATYVFKHSIIKVRAYFFIKDTFK